jgi:lipid A ethanolaminephosphotransferase
MAGYPRATNPRMATLKHVAHFPFTQACGTATAQSVPCIFSGLPRKEFSIEKANAQDNLLDILRRSNVDILWLDNDSGCKKVCDRHPNIDLTNSTDSRFCIEAGNCYDSILVDALKSRLEKPIERDTMIVLHLKGSHGPAYYKRYPPEFERFKPTCQTNELTRCDPESIVNAYDNTIAYTDHILGEVVALLQSQKELAPVMFYVSDHGESLGEKGLYLHGLPYAVAPDFQTRVPMMAWFSQTYLSMESWNINCPASRSQPGRRHEHVFQSLLGIFEVETSVYRPSLDLFAACEEESLPVAPAKK